ncbi:alpha/beta fold hydrolase [Alicyclobacillus dauci]|uniref:Alpha/beta hydrolase n=1 Tax=Alicyclobacillus dauci TaxID=1475485 RepID=A0ABY6YZN3_9BACL|nr:alpha/beta hydrolase [Alicyclobacillus dauci]WAH35917.1 alpha/beta hydrolase [Alicyclobacillus dauci]
MPYFCSDEHIIHYETIGSGKPILLIHGFTNHGFAWFPQISDLVYEGYQVILPDLPGHGMSKPCDRTVTVSGMANLIIQLLGSLHIERTSVCGLSLGGMIVQTLLINHAIHIERAVIANSSSNFTSEQARVNVEGWIQTLIQPNGPERRLENTWTKLVRPSFRDTALGRSVYAAWMNVNRRVDGQALARVANGMKQFDSRTRLPEVTVPTLVIGGRYDELIPAAEAEFIHKQIPNSELVVIEEAGHLSNLDAADQFNLALLSFLRQS